VDIPLYQVDAFTDRLFTGNPAAVCPLPQWLPEDTMQSMALENKLPETAFIVAQDGGYGLRWFTPAVEVSLCGHATLAAAHVVFTALHPDWQDVTFHSPSGPLTCRRVGDTVELDLPAVPWSEAAPAQVPDALIVALGPVRPVQVLTSMDYIVVLADERSVRDVRPDLAALATLDLRGVAVTAPGDTADICTRFFGPKLDIPEDSFTGSTHCALVPYWAARLGRRELQAAQLSTRLGRELAIRVTCRYEDDRVLLGGQARLYLEGTVHLDDADLADAAARG